MKMNMVHMNSKIRKKFDAKRLGPNHMDEIYQRRSYNLVALLNISIHCKRYNMKNSHKKKIHL